MKPYYEDEYVTLYHGDCRIVLADLPDASVDAVVTDPPYELGFMGKGWDASGIAYSVPMWAEVLRVLKPGGHVLAFGGTRTWHRMVVAIEDAGFEIRDELAWLYGSGFPKSLDVSKAIDKAGGESPERQAATLREARERAGMTRSDVAAAIGCTESSVRDWEEGRARAVGRSVEYITPSPEYRAKLADLLGYTADERRVVGVAEDRRGDGTVIGLGHAGELTEGGNTPQAEQWNGWGTALKPAHEPICLARKPLIGTVAANVLAHGTGALNIDGCRIGTGGGTKAGERQRKPDGRLTRWDEQSKGARNTIETLDAGRWPANVVLDDTAAAMLDQQSGTLHSQDPATRRSRSRAVGVTEMGTGSSVEYADTGGASRFFYVAKAAQHERPKVDGKGHATVKPVALMRWLVRLVTPPGGTVLDPFAGTGTTAEAAIVEGFRCTLIEAEADHLPLIETRLAKPIAPTLFGVDA